MRSSTIATLSVEPILPEQRICSVYPAGAVAASRVNPSDRGVGVGSLLGGAAVGVATGLAAAVPVAVGLPLGTTVGEAVDSLQAARMRASAMVHHARRAAMFVLRDGIGRIIGPRYCG
ncbi:MAG TPA: hypothetical protein VFH98_08665 [Candidatus Limnocylindria bacterium]|nr:hypothetical protein [Candidatus Limnocylindria bacterium]